MRKISYYTITLFLLWLWLPSSANAMLSMELTHGILGAIPVTIAPFIGNDKAPQSLATIITNDLQNSGRFRTTATRADYAITGQIKMVSASQYQVSVVLKETMGNQTPMTLLSKIYTTDNATLRKVAHNISDAVYQKITGTRGIFSTKISYIVVKTDEYGRKNYTLEVADQDGYNPRVLLSSPEPIMSPAWSPNGKYIAYVSFEHRKANIYMQNIATGGRTLISNAPGINGAPAFSPDSRRLALVLSITGTPNIYVMDLASHHLTQLTNDFYINTEPAWSPNGRTLLFTSNRSGGPQIYQVNLHNHAISRMTYDGAYNARASYTPDGNHIIMIHQASGIFSIGILDLDSGTMRVLSGQSNDATSPSIAPNGSMILYDTGIGNRNMLGMVSTDGNIQLTLPAQNGNAQDPAWSPFLS